MTGEHLFAPFNILAGVDPMISEAVIGRVYRNKKNGQLYIVDTIGLHTELEELTVGYKPLYEAGYKNYYRPLEGKDGFKNKFAEITIFH